MLPSWTENASPAAFMSCHEAREAGPFVGGDAGVADGAEVERPAGWCRGGGLRRGGARRRGQRVGQEGDAEPQ